MSSINKKNLARGTAGVVYTVPSGRKTSILDITLTNTTTSAVACSVYLPVHETAAGVSNALFYNVSIPGNSVVQWSGEQIITTQSTIVMSGTGITIHVMGEEL
jgi:hypothetical protein